MPFGGWFDAYYDEIFQPAIFAAGLEPHRADDLYRPSAIVHDIWSYTKRCKLILADLTTKNPNVFYELGLAHAIGKPAILVAESIEDIPFDLRALRILLYDKNRPNWAEQLRQEIQSAIAEVLISPLGAVLPSFLHTDDSDQPRVSPRDKELLEIRQELDVLKRAVRTSISSRSRVVPSTLWRTSRLTAREMNDQDIVEALTEEPAVISAPRDPLEVDRVMTELRKTFGKTLRSKRFDD